MWVGLRGGDEPVHAEGGLFTAGPDARECLAIRAKLRRSRLPLRERRAGWRGSRSCQASSPMLVVGMNTTKRTYQADLPSRATSGLAGRTGVARSRVTRPPVPVPHQGQTASWGRPAAEGRFRRGKWAPDAWDWRGSVWQLEGILLVVLLESPEQSNEPGPVAPHTYGLPVCARALSTATAARPLAGTAAGGGSTEPRQWRTGGRLRASGWPP